MVDAWDGIKVLDLQTEGAVNSSTNNTYSVKAVVDTNGLGKELGLEYVAYRVEDGVESLYEVKPFKAVKDENGIVTYELKEKIADAGVYRYAFRLYPVNANLPHRQDFAYVRWI